MWKTVRLGEVCDFSGGSQPPKRDFVYEPQDGYVRLIQIRDFKSDKNICYVPAAKANKLCSEEDILIGRYGASVGKILRGLSGSYNVALMKARPDERILDKRWLHTYLTSPMFQKPLAEVSSRSAQNGFSKKDIYDFRLPLPPLSEQKRIVERLDKSFAEIDKAIATAEAKEGEIKSLSSSLLTSVLNSYLGQSETIALQNVCDFFGDGDWIETKDQAPEGLRLIQTGNIKVGSFADRKKNARYIDEETFKRLRCTEIFAGDLLVSRLPDPVGRACLIPELGERAITAVDCTIIRPKRDFVDANYLNYYLQSNQYFENVQKVVTGATRQRISRKNLGQMPIIVPPLETQREIVRRLDRVSEKVKTLNGANSQSQAAYPKLKAAILKQELTPSEAV